ncbi:hypothetical protein L3D22_12365 [Lysobacter soli]|uniref:hypothetical protein n=1 Tax=Lysobacter soli TaxID=453783 RepID=UPI00209CD87D|nr:hypothetical protein [Lysobacter soli]UTA53166.1 hypothetical protein L3D22_12365 [Lysobacter soli]
MNQSSKIEQLITGYFTGTVEAITTLYQRELYGQVLILIYAAIDTAGLLDAPPSQTTASGESFKNWTKKYLLVQPNIEFDEVDLWGARCAVLHTFTSQSNLSNAGKAKELQYYSGDKESPAAKQFVSIAKTMQGGKHLPVHYEDFLQAFFAAIRAFVHDLDANCSSNSAYLDRLRNILQLHPVPAPL